MQQNSKLKEKKLADEVDKQYWDPSVKALALCPKIASVTTTTTSSARWRIPFIPLSVFQTDPCPVQHLPGHSIELDRRF
jgi:hypothetical protein